MSYQKTIIVGHLGGDPNMRYIPDGTAVASFSVATSRKWKDAGGEAQEKTVWWRVSAWRRIAETCNEYLKKGSLVLVEGEVSEPQPYQAKDGTWRASLDLTALTVKFLSSKSTGEAPAEPPSTGGADPDEEIPF